MVCFHENLKDYNFNNTNNSLNKVYKLCVLCVQQDNMISCDVTQEVNSSTAGVDCSVTSLLLSAHAQVQ